jgi:hypothetical protein
MQVLIGSFNQQNKLSVHMRKGAMKILKASHLDTSPLHVYGLSGPSQRYFFLFLVSLIGTLGRAS